MTHPAYDAIEAARKKSRHPGGMIEGKAARAGRMDRKGGGAVDASSWRPPVAHDLQPLNQEVIDTSLDVKRGISDRRGDIPERTKYAQGGSVQRRAGGFVIPPTDDKPVPVPGGWQSSDGNIWPTQREATNSPQQRAGGGRLTAHERQSLPKSDFALPGHGSGPKGAGSGSYPIPDESHARNALARASGKSVESAVRAKVHAKYPDIGEG